MRIFAVILVVVMLLLGGVWTIAFTQFGNDLLKPYIEDTIAQKTGQNIKLDKFSLRFSSVDIQASLENSIVAKVSGNTKLFSQWFDLDYHILANNLNMQTIKINKEIQLSGKAKGSLGDFDVNGKGNAFGSNLRFLAKIKDQKPLNLEIDAKKLQIDEILKVVGKPVYATGNIDIIANVKDENGKANGDMNVKIYSGIMNESLVLKDFNVNLPKKMSFNGDINANMKDQDILAQSSLLTSIANLKTTKTNYNLSSNLLNTDFKIKVPDLSKLEAIAKQPLKGSVDINGDVTLANNQLSVLNAKLIGLGGNIDATLKDNQLNAIINQIELSNVLALVGKPIALKGVLNGEAKISDLNPKKLKGNLNANIKNGEILSKGMKALSGIDFPSGIVFNQNLEANLAGEEVGFLIKLASNLLSIPSFKGQYNINNSDLSAEYDLMVSDLSKLESITKQKLSGKVEIKGDVEVKNQQLKALNTNAQILGGTIKANLKDNNLVAKASKIGIENIFALIGQNPLAKGILELDAKFDSNDFKNLNGNLNLSVANGSFVAESMSKMLEKDFPKNVKFTLKANSNFKDNIANFDANILSDLLNLNSIKGKFDIGKNILNSKYELNLPDLSKLKFLANKDLRGKIDANGDLIFDKELEFNLNSDILKGKLRADLKSNIFTAKLDKFVIKELTNMLTYPNFYNGTGDLNAKYDLKTSIGNFNLDIIEGRLVKSGLTNAISFAVQKDITQEVYKDGYVKGNINKNLIDFQAHMKAQKSELNISKGTMDTITSKLDIPVQMNIEKTDLNVHITGTSQDPKYNVKSDYIEKKIDKGIGKLIDKNMNEKDANVTKKLLKGLFGR